MTVAEGHSPSSALWTANGILRPKHRRTVRTDSGRRRLFRGIAEVLLSLIFFALIFDSGGELGIRIYAVGLLVLLSVAQFVRLRVYPQELLIWSAALMLIVPSLFASILKSIPFETIAVWTFPILVFPLVLAVVRANRMTVDQFINGGLLFALVILTLFYGRLNQIDQISAVHDYLAERSAGFFNEKKVFFENAMPVVYFQGTLALVMCAVLAIGRSRYITYTIVCTALLVAPSRFGLLLSLLFGFLMLTIKYRQRPALWLLLGLVVTSGLYVAHSLPDSSVEIFSSEGEGSRIRLLHFSSVMDLFDQKPYVLLTGDGPGTTFFSKGFGEMTDNIEISQLEVLRKFGMPFTIALTTFLGMICYRLLRRRYHSMALAIIAHYVVALSNPVLFALPAVFLFAIAISTLQSKRRPHA